VADLTDVAAIEDALGRSVTSAEEVLLGSLIPESSALIVGYLGCDPSVPGPVPADVGLVAARMIARLFQQTTDLVGAESTTEQAGPFSRTARYAPGSTSGQPWLTVNDKITLRPYRCGGGFRSVPMQSPQSGKYRTYD
jgi:hypothetical protein